MPNIRNYRSEDFDDLYAISLATGHLGDDAAHLYNDPKMMGHIYSAPYATLMPERVQVIEDELGVGGFVLGAFDTESWSERLEHEWWPQLRRVYDDASNIPVDQRTPDQRRAAMIHKPEKAPAGILADFPGHVHLNLLPRLQHRGLGAELLEVWLTAAKDQGLRSVHIGANHGNLGALRFWIRRGFTEITLDNDHRSRTLWMGLRMASDIHN